MKKLDQKSAKDYETEILALKRQISILEETNQAMRNLNHIKKHQTLIEIHKRALKNNVQMTLEQFIEFMALSHWGEKSYQHLSDEFHRVNSTGSITAYEFYESVLDILRYEKFKNLK